MGRQVIREASHGSPRPPNGPPAAKSSLNRSIRVYRSGPLPSPTDSTLEAPQMKILVDRLTATPAHFDFEGSPEWWQQKVIGGRDLDYVVDEPFRVGLDAYVVGEDVLLSGKLAGSIEVECGRCLQRYRHALAEDFRLLLEPAAGRAPSEPESAKALAADGVSLGDDLGIGWYQGSEIVLDAFFTEVISLALPLQPLCREECRGLCPRCGTDRNREACGCEEEVKAPSPFAVLAALRDEKDERDQ